MAIHAIHVTLKILSEDLCDSIRERLAMESEFTTVLSLSPKEIPQTSLVLLKLDASRFSSSNNYFTHIGILRKGQRVATGQVRVRVTDVIAFEPISVSGFLQGISKNLQAKFRMAADGQFSNIPPKTAEQIFEILLKIRPKNADSITRLAEKLNTPLNRKMKRMRDAAVEKDAVAICLDIFGVKRDKIMRSWHAREGLSGNSFLSGLTDYTLYEDNIIAYDLHTLPGWKQVSRSMTGMVEFESDEQDRMVIINANRNPLERALGVDLIYYHRTYQAFTFVQYKMMDYQNETKNWYYNPNQPSHNQELKRMLDLECRLAKETMPDTLFNYRFSDCPIFFKLCRKIEFHSQDSSIAPGAYLSLVHWNKLLTDSSTAGPRGGVQIGFHTLNKRYLGTQSFIELVQKGLLGTTMPASAKVDLFIKASIENGHSVIYAIDDSALDKKRGRKY